MRQFDRSPESPRPDLARLGELGANAHCRRPPGDGRSRDDRSRYDNHGARRLAADWRRQNDRRFVDGGRGSAPCRGRGRIPSGSRNAARRLRLRDVLQPRRGGTRRPRCGRSAVRLRCHRGGAAGRRFGHACAPDVGGTLALLAPSRPTPGAARRARGLCGGQPRPAARRGRLIGPHIRRAGARCAHAASHSMRAGVKVVREPPGVRRPRAESRRPGARRNTRPRAVAKWVHGALDRPGQPSNPPPGRSGADRVGTA
jgi:hypothetical protein